MFRFRRSRLLNLLSFIFVFLTICLYSGAYTDHIVFGESYGDDLSSLPKIINSLLKFPLYLFSGYLILKSLSTFKIAVSEFKVFLFFCAFCLINSFFSLVPSDSLFKLFSLAMTFVVAYGLAALSTRIKLDKFITLTFLVLMLSSIFYIYLIPEYGLMSASDDFEYSGLVGEKQGVFKHKNIFGAVSALGFLYALYFPSVAKNYRKYLILLCAFCLILANSATKVFAIIAIVLFIKFVHFTKIALSERFQKISIYFAVLGAVFAIALSVNILEQVIGFAGKDLTFTGRTVIWAHALEIASERPIWGYGLSSIWTSELGYIPELPYYIPIHSHNSFIETLLTSGFFGLSIIVYYVLNQFNKYSILSEGNKYADFFLASFTLALLDSFFEYTIFRGNSILFLFSLFAMLLMRFETVGIARNTHV